MPNNQYFLRKFILIFLISFSVKAQLLPPIQSYTPEEYNGANQNWMIDGSIDNKILFSNSEGLLVYDGTTWVNYNSPNGSLIRSVKFIDDLIYTGAHSDFGYWEKLSNGTLYYTSLIKKLNLMKKQDIQHSLIVVAEAVKKEDGKTVLHKYMDGEKRLGGIGDYIAEELMKKTDAECRVTSLGHVQRGAPPTASDRILASAFGVYAVDLINQEKCIRVWIFQPLEIHLYMQLVMVK